MRGVCFSLRAEVCCAAGMTHQLSCTPLSMGSAGKGVCGHLVREGGGKSEGDIHKQMSCMQAAAGGWGTVGKFVNTDECHKLKYEGRSSPHLKTPRLFFKAVPYPYLKTLFNNHTENQREGQYCVKHLQHMLLL